MRKFIGILLVIALLTSIFTIQAFAFEADEYEGELVNDSKIIYFDTKSAGWNNFTTVYCHVWACDGSGEWPEWQSEDEICKYDSKTGIASYNLSNLENKIGSDANWACIFSNDTGIQTYNLLLGSSCIGHTAFCDGTTYENPADSTKATLAAFWEGLDYVMYGPELQVTSIGNVVGTCCPDNSSPYDIFVAFLKNNFENAQIYSGKTDQVLLDDVAEGLALNADDIQTAIFEAGVSTTWSKAKSTVNTGGENTDIIYYTDTLDWGSVNIVYLVQDSTYTYKSMDSVFVNKNGNTVYKAEIPASSVSVYFCLGNDKAVTEETGEMFDGEMFYALGQKDEYGSYLLCTGDPSIDPIILGDVDNDGKVTISDVTSIQYILGKMNDKEYNEKAADVDGSGQISIIDGTIIQQYLLVLEIDYPVGEYI